MIQRRIVPQRTDGVIPRLDFLFAGKAQRLERHPIGDGHDASAPASGEIPANDLRQGPAVADDRRIALIIASAATLPKGSAQTEGTTRRRVSAK